jgi:hypothetical protein
MGEVPAEKQTNGNPERGFWIWAILIWFLNLCHLRNLRLRVLGSSL